MTGVQTCALPISALAYDHRNDIFSASAAAVGIFLTRSGLPLGDPVAGALVALLILRTGIKIIQDASADLMDNVPGKELAVQVNDLLRSLPGITRVEEVYAHRFGPYLVLSITIGIDGALSVLAGDRISSEAERILMENIRQLDTMGYDAIVMAQVSMRALLPDLTDVKTPLLCSFFTGYGAVADKLNEIKEGRV